MPKEKENRPVSSGLFLLARTGSSRLPRKSLLGVQGRPIVEHQIERLKAARFPSVFALATTILPEDDALCDVARRCGISCFRGSVQDVVERLLRAAEYYDVDFIACVGGDDVFAEGEFIDAVIEEYNRTEADFITIADVPFGTSPFGVSRSGLERVMEMKGGGSTEGWERYFTDFGLFRTRTIYIKDPSLNYPELRLDLDYPEDFELIQAIYDRLYKSRRQPSLRQVVHLLVEQEPALAKINREVHQKWLETRAKSSLSIR